MDVLGVQAVGQMLEKEQDLNLDIVQGIAPLVMEDGVVGLIGLLGAWPTIAQLMKYADPDIRNVNINQAVYHQGLLI